MDSTIKLHAFLAHAGLASRRGAEQFILDGKVTVNGKTEINVATRISPDKDVVTYLGKRVGLGATHTYLLLNKPVGVVSTVSDPDGKKTVMSFVHGQEKKARLYPVGRLDEESEGLLLMTDDGDLTYVLTHPKFQVQKMYRVLIAGAPGNTSLNTLRSGIRLKEGTALADAVEVAKHDRGDTWITIAIHQGWNRQVRRMCAAVQLEVLQLIRTKFGPFELGELQAGETRTLTEEEMTEVRRLRSLAKRR
jgi:23S rRNA pseudouridine2605 synthase